MSQKAVVAVLFSLLLAGAARAQARGADPVLDRLLVEVAEQSPELKQARSEVEAQAARVPQASALADPVLSLGIQNDGFKSIEVGTMETSFFLIMATQAFPFPGKRDLRTAVAAVEQRRSEARVVRVALSLEAQARRSYLDWMVAREQAALLEELWALWTKAEATARNRYESGQAPQSDLLRAQLELARLEQRRWSAATDISNRLAELNRLRVKPLGEPLSTTARLEEAIEVDLPSSAQALADAEARSPELALSTLGVEQATRRTELARREEYPDYAVSAGVMPRGSLPPMWSLTLAFNLPIFTGSKQGKATLESELRGIGETQGREAVRQVLALRTRQRLELLGSLLHTNLKTREVILPLSEATARSTLSQYEVGRVSFIAVLEALATWVNDRTSYLGGLADEQRVAIAQRELTLEAPSASGGFGGGSSMPQSSRGAPSAGAGGAAAPAGGQTQNQSMGSGM